MAKGAFRALCVSLVLVAACGPKSVRPVPTVSAPRFPDFVAPVAPTGTSAEAAAEQQRGWTLLQAGDVRRAERTFAAVLAAHADFSPAETALGYVELARKDAKAALVHFDRTLEREPANPSALVGRGQASLLANREADALAAFKAAAAADASLVDIRRRVEVLQFRVLSQGLTAARAAAHAGKFDEALRTYAAAIDSSPDSPFLYREMAAVERQVGDTAAAIDLLEKSVALDASDVGSFEQLGELLEAKGDLDAAATAYGRAFGIDPRPQFEAKRADLRARADVAKLPAEYHAIEGAMQITRGDLAALIGVRLAPLLDGPVRRAPPVMTDVRGHWAAAWIFVVARAGVMPPFDNHTFQPRAVLHRVDLAQAVAHLLERVAAEKPARAKAWQTPRLRFADVAPGHLGYPAVSVAVASGVLAVGPDGRFQPSRPVSGGDAVRAVNQVAGLADVPAPAKRGTP
ncbi:MAG: tetratricopeptide repeat protein [Acidobacteriota bacterium]